MDGKVIAVSSNAVHTFSKHNQDRISLITGLGVDGDAHMGTTVKHRSRVAQDPTQPNLRQVHLLHAELFDELQLEGFHVEPGQMGENITTRAIALLELPAGTRLSMGDTAVIEVTGLRTPCVQIDQFQRWLLSQVVDRDANGALVRKAGIMSIVLVGGQVAAGDSIRIELPPLPYRPLDRV
jgi:MOSC domain-containing protein YiiM